MMYYTIAVCYIIELTDYLILLYELDRSSRCSWAVENRRSGHLIGFLLCVSLFPVPLPQRPTLSKMSAKVDKCSCLNLFQLYWLLSVCVTQSFLVLNL